jgi:hypothetical protein
LAECVTAGARSLRADRGAAASPSLLRSPVKGLIRDRRALEASGAYPDLPDARRDHDVAVVGGLIAVAAGFEEGDAVAAILVAGIIFAAASRLIDENARVLMDTSPADARAKAEAAISGLGEAVGWV